MNCKAHPTTNKSTGTGHRRCQNTLIANSGSDTAIIGMPKVWHTRLTGCWWLREYSAIQVSTGLLPSTALLSALVLERHLDLGPIALDLAVLQLHVEL